MNGGDTFVTSASGLIRSCLKRSFSEEDAWKGPLKEASHKIKTMKRQAYGYRFGIAVGPCRPCVVVRLLADQNRLRCEFLRKCGRRGDHDCRFGKLVQRGKNAFCASGVQVRERFVKQQ